MKKLIFFLILLFQVSQSPALDISGRYRCRGNDFLNHTTFDEPTVVIKTGETFLFTWINKNLAFNGTGILQERTVSTVFWTPSNMASPGVVTYQVLANGDLKGKWTIKDSKIIGDEYCEKLK